MTKLESIVVSNTEPNSKNVLWYDNKRLLIFSNGHWSPIVDLDDIDTENSNSLVIAYVDGEKIKEDTWYCISEGKIVPAISQEIKF